MHGMGYGQMGYTQPGYNQMGYGYQQPRITKGMVIQDIRAGVVNCTGVMVSREERLDDAPAVLRHCCAEAGGITYLQPIPYTVPMLGLQFGVFFCPKCGKLFYPREIPV